MTLAGCWLGLAIHYASSATCPPLATVLQYYSYSYMPFQKQVLGLTHNTS
jgi:hypothetical protein